MPQQSKYSNEEFEALMAEIFVALEKKNADVQLSLMALGNVVTNILQNQVDAGQRKSLAEQFAKVLVKSVS
ncbi:DUF1414 domain-containing protein [Alteromonadaceae bacterium M269]|nr:DUF1414 domain-containing protein [Alteromonadaceae bacterium M269]